MEIEALNWVPVIGFAVLFVVALVELAIKPLTEKYKEESLRRTVHYCEAVDFVNTRNPGVLNKTLGHKVKRHKGAYIVSLLTEYRGHRKTITVEVKYNGRGYTCLARGIV